jgi:hypothetical protein
MNFNTVKSALMGARDPSDIQGFPPEPIPHLGLVRAVADGKTVQWKNYDKDDWEDFTGPRQALNFLVTKANQFEYRLKPDTRVQWLCMLTGGELFGPRDTKDETLKALANVGRMGSFVALLRIEINSLNFFEVEATTVMP